MSKTGRKPVSQRAILPTDSEEIFGNALTLDPELKAELEAKGLEGRFVDYKKLADFGGYHKHGWVPYKRKNDTIGTSDFKFGNDPDGLVRRGTVVLAVKPKEKVQIHRNHLRQKAAQYSAIGYHKQKADEIRTMAKETGGKVTVDDSFDEEEQA